MAYKSGISRFQERIKEAFGEGSEKNNWRIELSVVNSRTQKNLSLYNLVVFGSLTSGGKPPKYMVEYLSNLEDLNHTKVMLIATSIESKEAIPIMRNLVQNVNGKVVESLVFHTRDSAAVEKSRNMGLKYS